MLEFQAMTIVKSEFFLALNQVATERGISPDDVIDSIKQAVLAAYKKDYGANLPEPPAPPVEGEPVEEDTSLEVKINKDSGETHILLEGKDVTPPGFGRIAAQTARQVILQKIREAEKKTIIKHYITQVGTIIKGRVIRFDGKNVTFDIGKAEGVLPFEEQIRTENYKLNDPYIVFIKEINQDDFGNSRIVLSRIDPRLVEELFKKEVPEVASGTVKINKVMREPGDRAKIAVSSSQSGVDPVGACVGQKGIRVKAVTDELGGDEKIDIIQFNTDDSLFIREALSPATVGDIEIDADKKNAKVRVDATQAPLAIGKSGVNVNLASRLTGYEIDIIQVETKPEEKIEEKKEEKKPEEEKAAESEEKPVEETKEETPEPVAVAPEESKPEEIKEAV